MSQRYITMLATSQMLLIHTRHRFTLKFALFQVSLVDCCTKAATHNRDQHYTNGDDCMESHSNKKLSCCKENEQRSTVVRNAAVQMDWLSCIQSVLK